MSPLSSEEILSGLIHSANSDNKTLQEEIEKLKYRVYNLEKNINSIMQIIREMK